MATLSSVLSQIRQNESGSAAGNYTLTPQQNYAYPASHASGAYQFQPGTWQSLTQKSGIGTQYSEAYQAPPNVQDAVAAYALEQNPNANSSSLWGGGKTSYPMVTEYDVSSQQLASGSSLGGTTTTTANSPSYYEGYDENGTFLGGTSDPNAYPVSGATTYNPVYSGTSSGTGTTTGTGTTGTSTTSNPAISGIGAGQPGYLPPAATGGPMAVGITPGLATGIGSWISNIETAVGNWMTTAFKALFGSLVDWFARFWLMVIGVLLILVALWRILDPDGEKAKAVVSHVAAAA